MKTATSILKAVFQMDLD